MSIPCCHVRWEDESVGCLMEEQDVQSDVVRYDEIKVVDGHVGVRVRLEEDVCVEEEHVSTGALLESATCTSEGGQDVRGCR